MIIKINPALLNRKFLNQKSLIFGILLLVQCVVIDYCECKKSTKSEVVDQVERLPDEPKGDWKIVFYTGSLIWAGTDSDIFVELIGDSGNSPVITLKPGKPQLEAQSVDMFILGDFSNRSIGNLKSIIVGKQHSYAFFNDWQLIKVEVTDPLGKKYLFQCNCWLTSLKYRRVINLTSVEGVPVDSVSGYTLSARNSRVFPMTLGLLFIFLLLVFFSYFGNVLCKKWRENIEYLANRGHINRNSTRRINDLLNNNRRNNSASRSNHDDEGVDSRGYNSRQTQYDYYETSVHGMTNFNEDKPPDYKLLFPNKIDSSQTNLSNHQPAANTTTATPTIVTQTAQSNVETRTVADPAVISVQNQNGSTNV